MGEDFRSLSAGTLLFRLLGSLSVSDSARTAYDLRKGFRRNGARRKVEQYFAATLGTVCPKNAVVFKERGDARAYVCFYFCIATTMNWLSLLTEPLPNLD